MKKLMLSILCIGAVFAGKYPDAIAEGKWTEEEIVPKPHRGENDGWYLSARMEQLIRKAQFLHFRYEVDESYKYYQEAAYLGLKLGQYLDEDETFCYPHCPYLIAGLCFNKSCPGGDREREKECYKKCYKPILSLVMNIDSPIEHPIQQFFYLNLLEKGAFAAYLYGDQEAFAQLLYKQMVILESESFTSLIYYMEELQYVANAEFPKDHWVISKMKAQMEQKIIKEIEDDSRIALRRLYNARDVLSLFYRRLPRHEIYAMDYFENKSPYRYKC